MKCFAGQIKQVIWIIPFCITVFSPLSVHALTVEEVPNPQQVNGTWVTDMANILSEDTESQLNQMISQLEIENGTEIAVVTVLETSPAASPKAFTTELFNHWGIGKADEDNGVLFLISTGDRRVEIETGYGIESILPDAQVGKIIETQITPFFKQNNFDAGTLAGTQALVVQLGGEVNPIPANPKKQPITPESTELPKSQVNTFQQALDSGMSAATLAQSAQYQEDWNLVASLWQRAIDLLKSVPDDSANAEKAQEKITEYQRNLEIAQQNAQNAPSSAAQTSTSENPTVASPTPTPQTNTAPIRRNPSLSVQQSNSDTSSGFNGLAMAFVLLLFPGLPIILLISASRSSSRQRRVLVKPEGKTRTQGYPYSNRRLHCADCKKQLEHLDAIALESKLTQPEKVAQKIGSIRFDGWQCPRCRPHLTGEGVHIFAYVSNSVDFEKCLTCQELTVTRKLETILKEPTWNQKGEKLVHKECHCCDYQAQMKEAIPCLTPPANAIFLKPNGRSRVSLDLNPDLHHPHKHCADCNYPMQLIGTDDLPSHLTRPQKVAQTIGSIQLKGWKCPNCLGVHIRTYVVISSKFYKCHHCQELTVIRTKNTVKQATTNSTGKYLIISDCQCCDYHYEKAETIPRLRPAYSSSYSSSPSSSSSYSSSSDSSWNDSSSSSAIWCSSSDDSSSSGDSYSSDSSSSSDFGGGDSGGGGAGGDW
ncbi:TPM domain-containing protein [Coleofasciculus chthonoplastes]|uniref:TPM domain-containing protein n=1 Tax=Coleofasciculus chthonoplastes TaxID=64178 RepID=UPI003300D68D